MLWFLYNTAFTFFFIAALPHYLWRMRRRGGYRKDFLQRVAIYRPEVRAALEEGGRLWLHAVSVGEIYVAFSLMEELRQRMPGARFLLSTTTSTAHAIARKRVAAPDLLIYFPLDLPLIQRRLFRLARPRLLALIECELWPNLIRQAQDFHVPLFLVNGRLSPSSFRGYRRLCFLTRRLLPGFEKLFVQTAADAARMIELGAPSERVRVMGSAKYEMPTDPQAAVERAQSALRAAGFSESDRFWIAASTWPGEESIALDIHREVRRGRPNLKLLIAPRHVERADEILDEIRARGLSVARRTESSVEPRPEVSGAAPDVFLLDTTGELKDFYAVAEVVFIGKSLTEHGGQNPIEPAALGRAVVVGPHMENFAVVVEELRQAGGLVEVHNAEEWKHALIRLLDDPEERAALGRRAEALVGRKAGALRRTADEIVSSL